MTRHALLSTITRIVLFITFTVGFALTAFAPALGWRATGLVVMAAAGSLLAHPIACRLICILSTRCVPSCRGEVDRVTGRYVAGLSWLGLSGRWFSGFIA